MQKPDIYPSITQVTEHLREGMKFTSLSGIRYDIANKYKPPIPRGFVQKPTGQHRDTLFYTGSATYRQVHTLMPSTRSIDVFFKTMALPPSPREETLDLYSRFNEEYAHLTALSGIEDIPQPVELIHLNPVEHGYVDVALVTTFLNGIPLHYLLASGYEPDFHGMPVKEKLQMLRRFISKVAKINNRNILHNDLKASNTIYSADQRLSIIDFNNAERTDHPIANRQRRVTRYTPEFIAPEVYTEGFTYSTEAYSLGLLVASVLSGKEIGHFDEPSTAESARKLQDHTFRILNCDSDLNRSYVHILQAISKALSPTPTQRYNHAAEFLQDFSVMLYFPDLEKLLHEYQIPIQNMDPDEMEELFKETMINFGQQSLQLLQNFIAFSEFCLHNKTKVQSKEVLEYFEDLKKQIAQSRSNSIFPGFKFMTAKTVELVKQGLVDKDPLEKYFRDIALKSGLNTWSRIGNKNEAYKQVSFDTHKTILQTSSL